MTDHREAVELVHVEIASTILCCDDKSLNLLNCDWRSEAMMWNAITCPACLEAISHRFDDEEDDQ